MLDFFLPRGPAAMPPLADLFVRVFVPVDDALKTGAVAVPRRPGPALACTDAGVLTVTLVRRLLGRPCEAGFLAAVRRDWRHSFPVPSAFDRRVRWLWGAFEQLRQRVVAAAPANGWQQVDTTALPVAHPSHVRGADGWHGPGLVVAGFSWDMAHRAWFDGVRLALRTDLGDHRRSGAEDLG